MNEYLAIFATLFLISFLVIEVLLWAYVKGGLKLEIGLSVLILLFSVLYLFYGEGSEYARENQALLLLFTETVFVVMPICLILAFNRLQAKFEKLVFTHIAVVLLSLVLGAVLPIFALVTSCFTGLDCV